MGLDITERLPLSLAVERVIAAYIRSGGSAPDLSVGGLPFHFRMSDQLPLVRRTADFRRQQIDTSPEPGEQTLSSWWTRDQDSWHRGAGISFYEPGSVPSTRYRYARSVGVDVWTKGEVTLLRAMDRTVPAMAADSVFTTSATVSAVDCVIANVGGALSRINQDGEISTISSPSPAFGEPVIAGSKFLVGSPAGILAGDASGSSAQVLWSTSSNRNPRVWWVKSRIVAAAGPNLYDLTMTGGSLDGAPELWKHPSPTWTWTGVSEAPGAILAAGYEAGRGGVYAFTLEQPSSGSVPVLSAGAQVAELPPGEEIHAMRTYLGNTVALGTSRGLRIGDLAADGKLNLGPLTVETTRPVRALTFADRFCYAAISRDVDGDSGCARVDLTEEIDEQAPTIQGQSQAGASYRRTLRFAWAYDATVDHDGQVDSVSMLGGTDRVVLGVAGSGLWVQSLATYVPRGYLLTGRIRFGTSENKRFLRGRILGEYPSAAVMDVAVLDDRDVETYLLTLGDSTTQGDIALPVIGERPMVAASLRLTLRGDGTTTPVLRDLQVKALPVVKVQRDISYPLNLSDRESDRNGTKVGFDGAAWARLQVLEQMEEEQAIVNIEDHTTGERYTGVIQQVTVERTTNPSRGADNAGARLQLVVKKL